jgi:cysteinyl-tRNA synthetase
MPLRFFNTYSRQLEEFEPRDTASRKIDIYTCGPTVYSRAHIGNFRAYVFEDLLQRHLELRDYKVHRVMNITDVDDKTIRGAREAKVSLSKFTEPFKQAFFEDIDTLRIKRADEFPSATEERYLQKMIEMIGALISRGLAYQAEDKSVYYRINKFPDYGKLAHIDLTQLQSTGRVKHDEYDKEHIGDFALWKAWDEEDGNVKWDSPWGPGRPGWHIECSAMATAILGDQIDIHCGGVDNIFPHHEAEIAQSECVTGKSFVKLWMHCKHLLVDNQKMSKSAGNFHTLRDLLELGWTGREVRYVLLSVKYREPLNFTFDGLAAARSALARLDEWGRRLAESAVAAAEPLPADLDLESFGAALDDDLNASAALGALFEIIRETNKRLDAGILTPGQVRALANWRDSANSILRFEPDVALVPAEVETLLVKRAEARGAKNFAESDLLRDEIAALGWIVKDTREGQKLSKS